MPLKQLCYHSHVFLSVFVHKQEGNLIGTNFPVSQGCCSLLYVMVPS
jgi:hypothetical protein